MHDAVAPSGRRDVYAPLFFLATLGDFFAADDGVQQNTAKAHGNPNLALSSFFIRRSYESLMKEINLTAFETGAIYCILAIAGVSLIYAWLLFRNVMAEDKGTPAMIRIWTAIKEGADAYLSRQAKTILPFIGILLFALFGSVWISSPTPEAIEMYGDNARI